MFKNPFSFKGRIRRTEYGLSLLIYFFVYGIATVGIEMAGAGLILVLLLIPALWFLWAQGAKRCHDRDNTGWFQIIPFYGLWMLFASGDEGRNRFGEDPKTRLAFDVNTEEA